MSFPQNPGYKVNLAAGAALFAGVAGIFWLPWFVPVRTRVDSMSYTYGFNNLAADMAFAGLLLALFLIFLRRRQAAGSGVTEMRLSGLLFSDAEEGRGDKRLRAAFAVVTALAVGAVITWFNMVPYPDFAECGFFASRLDLMALGLKPFRDFEFNYGPGMLYPTYWLYRLCGGRLSIDGAYGVTLAAHWAAGFCLLYYVIANLRGAVNRALIFACIAVSIFTVSLGLQYTPLRFICMPAALFFIHQMFSGRKDDGAATFAKIAALAFLLPLGILSFSPEMGIASAAGIAVYFASMFRTPQRQWCGVALAPCAALATAILAFSKDYLEAILTRTGGSDTFPVFPTAHVLLLTGAACWILPQLGIIGVCERNTRGAMCLALAVSCGLLIPACLTHSDDGHVFLNGLVFFILLPALALQLGNKTASRALMVLYIGICPVLGTVGCWKMYLPLVTDALNIRRQLAELQREGKFDPARNAETWREETGAATGAGGGLVYGKLLVYRDDFKGLMRYPKIGMPMGGDERIAQFLKLSGRFAPEYYSGINEQVFTEASIQRKLEDMKRMEFILVPKIYFAKLKEATEADNVTYDNQTLSSWLMFPVSMTPRNPRLAADMEVAAAVVAEYGVVGEYRDNWVLRRER